MCLLHIYFVYTKHHIHMHRNHLIENYLFRFVWMAIKWTKTNKLTNSICIIFMVTCPINRHINVNMKWSKHRVYFFLLSLRYAVAHGQVFRKNSWFIFNSISLLGVCRICKLHTIALLCLLCGHCLQLLSGFISCEYLNLNMIWRYVINSYMIMHAYCIWRWTYTCHIIMPRRKFCFSVSPSNFAMFNVWSKMEYRRLVANEKL